MALPNVDLEVGDLAGMVAVVGQGFRAGGAGGAAQRDLHGVLDDRSHPQRPPPRRRQRLHSGAGVGDRGGGLAQRGARGSEGCVDVAAVGGVVGVAALVVRGPGAQRRGPPVPGLPLGAWRAAGGSVRGPDTS